MSYTKDFNIFVGGTTGAFKGLKLTEKTCIPKNIQSLMAITDDHEITAMAWGDPEEREILLACGSKGIRSVKIYDTEYSAFTSSFNCDIGKGKIRGISRYDDAVITAVESGDVKLWRCDENEQMTINAGDNLHRMRHSEVNRNIIATGGCENELKLFDLQKQKKVFTEKNVRPDTLQLRIPVWISDIGFLPNSNLVATASRYGYVRLFDPGSTQRRPVINLQIKDEALTTLTPAQKDMHVVVGSGKGRMNLIDLRKPGKILNTYKDFAGGITDLACSRSEPLIASVSLDRYLRIHHLETKKLLKKVYLVFSLNAMLMRSSFSLKPDDEHSDDTAKNVKRSESSQTKDQSSIKNSAKDQDSEAEYDELFGEMPIIANEANEADLIENKRRYPREKPTVIDSAMKLDGVEKSVKLLGTKPIKKKRKLR